MDDEPSLEEVGAFLRDRIESVEQLETLLLIHRRRTEAWTAATVSRELQLTVGAAADALDRLCRWSLLDVHVGRDALLFRYAPATPELAASVNLLAQLYRTRQAELLRLLSGQAVERVRTSAIRLLVDAFLAGSWSRRERGGKKGS